jgi:hypothetical protein
MPRNSRDRFWWSLALSVPVVAFSSMFADLMGYTRPAGTGRISQCAPIGVSRRELGIPNAGSGTAGSADCPDGWVSARRF